MKRETLVAVKSVLLVAVMVLGVQLAAPCVEPVFQSLVGVRLTDGAQVRFVLTSGSEEGVVTFQVYWSTEVTGTFEPLGESFPANGLDNSDYSGVYAAPVSGGPLFLQVVATMGDASTQVSDTILVTDQVVIRRVLNYSAPKNWEASRH